MKFSKGPEIIEGGVEACWKNCVALVASARQLFQAGQRAPALSLAVLALEETGKMILIDGLLFAQEVDDRTEGFRKSLRDHKYKVSILSVFPLFLTYLARLDPRYNSEAAFNLTIADTIRELGERLRSLRQWLGAELDLCDLDKWKQKGFYVHLNGHKMVSPTEGVAPALSEAVVGFSSLMVDSVDFILKLNIEKYKARIRKARESFTEEMLIQLRNEAERIIEASFSRREEREDG